MENYLEKENKQLKKDKEKLLNMLMKIAYCTWNNEELENLLLEYGCGNN